MRGGRTFQLAVIVLVVGTLAVVGVGTALARGPWGPGPFGGMTGGYGAGPGGGMMGGYGPGGMMGGYGPGSGGMMGGYGPGGMMGGWSGQAPANQGEPIGIDKAQQAVQAYVDATGNKDLVVDEIMEFQYNYYAIVKEKSTGIGAFELLVNKYTGAVFPEYGPNMMWNTKYGMMGGGGMMGGYGPGGMMRGPYGGGPGGTANQPSVTSDQAKTIAQQWLDQNQPGSTTETPDQFYGYYTLHILKDGQITGMLSVNAYTGQVWYHTWHGAFVQMKELEQ